MTVTVIVTAAVLALLAVGAFAVGYRLGSVEGREAEKREQFDHGRWPFR